MHHHKFLPEPIPQAMDLIHKFLNLAAPTFTFFCFFFFLLPFYFFKSLKSIFSTIFSENLACKVVLITGASSGIGEHLAYEYGKRGARLSLAARRLNRLQEVADMARELGSPQVLTIQADVSKRNDCKSMVDQTINHYGRLDHLVNNAGIGSFSMFEETTDVDVFRKLMDTNFWGSVYTTYFAVPHLKESNGKIIAISSAASWLPTPRMAFYNASKAAVKSFFETLRVELGNQIQITIVTPGFIESELTQGKILSGEGEMRVDQEIRDVMVSTTPVGSVSGCAKAIVNSACRGDRYLTQPSWYKMTYVWKVFWPEMVEWHFRLFYLTHPSRRDFPLGKMILDITGSQQVLYPSSTQSSEIKTD